MKAADRLKALERKCRQHGLTPDEMREANRLRRRVRGNAGLRNRYWTDPAYRQHKLAYRRTLEAAE